MTTTAVYIGQSTVQVTNSFAAGSGAANMTPFMKFANAVSDAITGTQPAQAGELSGITFTTASGITAQSSSGWVLHDSFWGGKDASAGTASPVYTQVFKAANKDGLSYKYAILRYNTRYSEINITTCENWDAVTHTATNEAWTYFDCAPIGYNLSACEMIIMVSPRWLCLHSFLGGEPSLWSGVFENAREDSVDTAANNSVCWSWMGSTLQTLGSINLTSSPLNGSSQPLISMPKTKTGLTSVNSAKDWGVDFGVGAHPHFGVTNALTLAYYMGSGNKFIGNDWDATRRLLLPIKPIFNFFGAKVLNYGQIFGIKLAAPTGVNMNQITAEVDADGNGNAAGADREHWLLNQHFKTHGTDLTSWFSNPSWTSEAITLAKQPSIVLTTGSAYYALALDGTTLYKIDANTKQVSTVLTGTGYTDLKFDGERYLYVTSSGTTASLTRLDTADDTTVSTFNSVGFKCCSITGDTVVCAPFVTSATPIFYRFVRQASTGAVSAITAAATATLTSPTITTSIIYDMTVDFEGNVWAATMVAAASNRLLKITPSAITANGTIGISTAPVNVGFEVLDGDNIILGHAVSSSNYQQYQFNPRTGTLVGSQSISTLSALTSAKAMVIRKIAGVIVALPNNSAQANVVALNSLGKTITNALAVPVLGADWGSTGMVGAVTDDYLNYDGARILTTTSTGFKIWTNVHGGLNVGGNPQGTNRLAQIAIPA